MDRNSQIRDMLSKYPSKSVVLEHILDLDRLGFNDLVWKAKIENRYINDCYSEVFVMDGTMPVNYKGQNYNIPITIVLPFNYPFSPPILTIKPKVNMWIAPNHPNVDVNGNVRHEYLSDWKSDSDLPTIMQILLFAFSEKTPLYAKSPQHPPQTLTNSLSPQSGGQTAASYRNSLNEWHRKLQQPPYSNPVGGISSAGVWGTRAPYPTSIPDANTLAHMPQPMASNQFPTPLDPLPSTSTPQFLQAHVQDSLPYPPQSSRVPSPRFMSVHGLTSAAPVVNSSHASREALQTSSFSTQHRQQQEAGGGCGQETSRATSTVNKSCATSGGGGNSSASAGGLSSVVEDCKFESQFVKELQCPVCLGLVDEAVESDCCHQVFCESCINNQVNKCPKCRQQPFQVQPSIITRRLIGRMTIECEFCHTQVERANRNEHATLCDKRPLKCTAPNCQIQSANREEFTMHLANTHHEQH